MEGKDNGRTSILCDCCGTEIMAERAGDRIIIQRMRSGRLHIAVIQIDEKWYSKRDNEPETSEPATTGQRS